MGPLGIWAAAAMLTLASGTAGAQDRGPRDGARGERTPGGDWSSRGDRTQRADWGRGDRIKATKAPAHCGAFVFETSAATTAARSPAVPCEWLHIAGSVLAALFITHGVFLMSCWLFSRDYALFRSSENQAAPRPGRSRKKLFVVGGPTRASEALGLQAVGRDAMAGPMRAES